VQVPVRMTQISVAWICRERWQTPLGICSGAVTAQHYLHGCAMPEIMKPRATPVRGITQSDLSRQADKRPPRIVIAHASAIAGYEKWFDVMPVEVVVAPLQISSQCGASRRMKRNQPRLAKLGVTDRENPVVRPTSDKFSLSASPIRNPETLSNP
jgi:hypothetical protein